MHHLRLFEFVTIFCCFRPWRKYGQKLGGTGWKLWCGRVRYCNLVDTWDTRARAEVNFESFEIEDTTSDYGMLFSAIILNNNIKSNLVL